MAKPRGQELGVSGTSMLNGVITEEYNTALSGREGVEVYDEMRKSDGTVRATVQAMSLPIQRAHWYVKPSDENDPKAVEIAEFVEWNLMHGMSITWADFLRQALLMLPLGCMPFEKVFDFKVDPTGAERIIWKKLAPRMAKSIYYWQMENGEAGVQQFTDDGRIINIPIEKLLIFTNEKEGDNWWGTSILRAPYKHWFFKNTFYKLDAIAFERQGVGIPYAITPQSTTDEDIAKAERSLSRLRANEEAYMLIPYGWEVGFMDMKGSSTRDPEKSIAHHNREITKSMLAQFLELGAGSTGSYALSENQQDLFLKSLEAVAHSIKDPFNKYAIPQLVDMNFDTNDYPTLEFADIAHTDVEKLATAYSSLVTSSAIRPQEADETHFRALLGLPDQEEAADEEVDGPEAEPTTPEPTDDEVDEALAEIEMSEDGLRFMPKKKSNDTTLKQHSEQLQAKLARMPRAQRMDFCTQNIKTIAHSDKPRCRAYVTVLSEFLRIDRSQVFKENNDYKGWRPLTFAEKKVNLTGLNKELDRIESKLTVDAKALLKKEKEVFVAKLEDAIRKNDTAAIKKLEMAMAGKLAAIIKKSSKEAYNYGKNSAAREMNVKTPASKLVTTQQLDISADTAAKRTAEKMSSAAKQTLAQGISKGETVAVVIASVDKAIAKVIDADVNTIAGITGGQYMNYGRNATFQANLGDIYALQRSEILDQRTCNYCLSVDGRIVEKDDPFAQNTIFHSGCFIAGTQVKTKDGDKNIEDVKVGEKVYTHKDNWKSVYHTMARAYSGDIMHIELENGKVITCTPNHPFWVNGEWVPAEDLTADSVLSSDILDIV